MLLRTGSAEPRDTPEQGWKPAASLVRYAAEPNRDPQARRWLPALLPIRADRAPQRRARIRARWMAWWPPDQRPTATCPDERWSRLEPATGMRSSSDP